MNAVWMMSLAVMFLFEPEESVDIAASRAISRDADQLESVSRPVAEKGHHARITSVSSDFDHKEGVALFEDNVVLRYSDDCVLCADRLVAFMAGSNQLDRVIVSGNVSITNATRVGTCTLAFFRRGRGEIEMFGDGSNTVARLVENGESESSLEGSRIKFWIDTEQVEVDSSRITTQTDEGSRKIL